MSELNIERKKDVGEKFCKDCGQIINEKAEICPKCGVRQIPLHIVNGNSGLNGKNKIVAALLAILLGWMGAHKFYLGQIGMGILYLVFCWTGIPWIISIIEFVIYLAMSEEAFYKKYGGA